MNISIATAPEELSAVYRFRYSIYVDEMKRPQQYADQAKKQIKDPLDTFGHVLIAKHNGNLIGTLRTNFLRDGDIGAYKWLYRLGNLSADETYGTSITTRLMITRKYRSGTLAVKLAKAVYQFGLMNGIEIDFIDCNAPLNEFFLRLGHKPVHQVFHPEYGNVTVMKLNLRDDPHLRSIKSPFLQLLKDSNLAEAI